MARVVSARLAAACVLRQCMMRPAPPGVLLRERERERVVTLVSAVRASGAARDDACGAAPRLDFEIAFELRGSSIHIVCELAGVQPSAASLRSRDV